MSMDNREAKKMAVLEGLEEQMEFLAVTGVEDKLQEKEDKISKLEQQVEQGNDMLANLLQRM